MLEGLECRLEALLGELVAGPLVGLLHFVESQ